VNYRQKHIDQPMSLLDSRLRQAGRYGHYYFDMDGTSSTVFSNLYLSGSRDFLATDDRLDIVHGSENHHRHTAVRRAAWPACPRRLSSLPSGRAMEHEPHVEVADARFGPSTLPERDSDAGAGRHAVSSQRQKDQRGWILAGCGPFDQEKDCLRLGPESGGPDLANPATLGWRTVGIAHQHAPAPEKWSDADRTGCADGQRGFSMAAGTAVSSRWRWVLRHTGRKAVGRCDDHFPDQTQCQPVRSSAKAKTQTAWSSSHQRQQTGQAGENGRPSSKLAHSEISSAGQNRQTARVYSHCPLVYGHPRADPAGDQSRPKGQRERRFLFHDRCHDGPGRGAGMLRRPLGNRRHIQKHQAIPRRPAAPNVETPRSRASSRIGLVAVFDGVAVVSQAKAEAKIFPRSAVVPSEDGSELCRDRINSMFGKSAVHDKKFEFLLEALAPAA